MDKKQLYIVMVVSVLMLVGILVYRWVRGDSGETESKKSSKPPIAKTQGMSPARPAGMASGKTAARPAGMAPGKTAARPGSKARPAALQAAAQPKESLDVAGVTDPAKLRRTFFVAIDQQQKAAAQAALTQRLTLASGNTALLAILDDVLDVFGRDPKRTWLAKRCAGVPGRIQVTPKQGAFAKAYAQAALEVLGGKAPAAVAVYWQRAQAAARNDAQRSRVLSWRCLDQVRASSWALAQNTCQQALQKGAGHRAMVGLAATLLHKDPSNADARVRLEQALKLAPTDPEVATLLAPAYQKAGKAKDAERVLMVAAKALADSGQHHAAIALLQRAIKLAQKAAGPWQALARSRESLGAKKQALAAYREAAKRAKGDVSIRLAIARLMQAKNLIGAVHELELAAQIDPANQGVKTALANLRKKIAARRPKAQPERFTSIDGKLMHLVFTTRGGTPRVVVLKAKKYRERGKVDLSHLKKAGITLPKELRKQVNLVRTWSPYWLPLRLGFPKSTFTFPQGWGHPQDWARLRWDASKKAFRLLRKGEAHAVRRGKQWVFGYRWPVMYDGMKPPEVVIERWYALDPDHSYAWQMEVRVQNRVNRKQVVRMTLRIPTVDSVKEDRSMFNPISLKKEAICMVGDKVYMQTLPSLFGHKKGCMGCDASSCACRRTPAKSKEFNGRVRWAGIDEMYFMIAAASDAKEDADCRLGGEKHGVLHTTVAFGERTIPHKDSFVKWNFVVYSGPKIQERLDQIKVAGTNSKLGEAVDYGLFWFIGRPMIWLMKQIYKVVGNWGIAIILLTLLIKLITMPLTMKQMRSMKGMSKLKPEMDRLKEKYGDDKQRFQQEMWALYKAHKINPLGGCLPLVIQMPIYIAWYQALMVSVDLYQAPLFGWITDLTKPDTIQLFGYGVPILPLFMGATMFLQQRMTPTTVDSAQQKMMMYMMPAMFTFFMLFLPSGLTLYILTNTVLTMLHQWYMNHTE